MYINAENEIQIENILPHFENAEVLLKIIADFNELIHANNTVC